MVDDGPDLLQGFPDDNVDDGLPRVGFPGRGVPSVRGVAAAAAGEQDLSVSYEQQVHVQDRALGGV
jgi:hypothetical protein